MGFTDKEGDKESIYYTVTDIQGSVTEVYDSDSKLVWKSGYTAFGIKAGETTKLLDFDGLYTGCDYDAETGLTYHWNRWRSEDGDSWLTQDPIRDGLNWWNYCNGNPLSYTDPDGLEGKLYGYLRKLFSFDNSSFGIATNNNTNFKVPTPQSVIEDASIDFIKNFDQDKALDTLQTGLDVAGVFFDPADALNGTISLARGNYVDARLNFVSVVPLVGDAIGKGGKVGKTIIQHGDDVADVGKLLFKNSDEIVSSGLSWNKFQSYTKGMFKNRTEAAKVYNSFQKGTIKLKFADNATYGLRFYDNVNAFPEGRYLFPTFTNYTNRNNLALLTNWNQMTSIAQFQIRPSKMYFEGFAASQMSEFTKYSYPGGALQWFVPKTDWLRRIK